MEGYINHETGEIINHGPRNEGDNCEGRGHEYCAENLFCNNDSVCASCDDLKHNDHAEEWGVNNRMHDVPGGAWTKCNIKPYQHPCSDHIHCSHGLHCNLSEKTDNEQCLNIDGTKDPDTGETVSCDGLGRSLCEKKPGCMYYPPNSGRCEYHGSCEPNPMPFSWQHKYLYGEDALSKLELDAEIGGMVDVAISKDGSGHFHPARFEAPRYTDNTFIPQWWGGDYDRRATLCTTQKTSWGCESVHPEERISSVFDIKNNLPNTRNLCRWTGKPHEKDDNDNIIDHRGPTIYCDWEPGKTVNGAFIPGGRDVHPEGGPGRFITWRETHREDCNDLSGQCTSKIGAPVPDNDGESRGEGVGHLCFYKELNEDGTINPEGDCSTHGYSRNHQQNKLHVPCKYNLYCSDVKRSGWSAGGRPVDINYTKTCHDETGNCDNKIRQLPGSDVKGQYCFYKSKDDIETNGQCSDTGWQTKSHNGLNYHAHAHHQIPFVCHRN